ncbi:MAG: helicase-related protein [Candidatus Parvarchaeota archaeon]
MLNQDERELKEKDIVMGTLFEGSFKMGFLKELSFQNEYRTVFSDIKNTVFQTFKDISENNGLIEKVKETFMKAEEDPSKWENINTNIFSEIFLLGYFSGLNYAKQVKKEHKNISLIRYYVGREEQIVVWRNADLVFIADDVLYIIDFKLDSYNKRREAIFSKQAVIPINIYGTQVGLSLGEIDITDYVLKGIIPNIKVIEEEIEEITLEEKGEFQLLSYALDFLINSQEAKTHNIDRVVCKLIYPLSEPLKKSFKIDREKLHLIAEEHINFIKSIYIKLKSVENPFEKEKNTNPEVAKNMYTKKIEKLKDEMNALEKSIEKVDIGDISAVREDVSKEVESFVKNKDLDVLVLLHSAGGGKTTSIIKNVINQEGKNVFLFFTPRKAIIDKVKHQLYSLGNGNIYVFTSKDVELEQKTKGKFVEHTGKEFKPMNGEDGKLKLVVDKIKLDYGKKEKIFGIVTLQSITTTKTQKGEIKKTSVYIGNLHNDVVLRKENIYHFVIDEFLGSTNGVYAIKELLLQVETIKKFGGKAKLYLLDANGYSANVLKLLLSEYDKDRIVNFGIFSIPFKSRDEFKYNNLNIRVVAKHGYPATGLYIYRKFIEIQEIQSTMKEIFDYIKSTRQGKVSYVYVQNKNYISALDDLMYNEGIKTLIITSSKESSQEEVNKEDYEIFIGTSSSSRGIDLKNVENIYILITGNRLEENLVEIIQAISRARGNEKSEQKERHLYLIYLYKLKDLDNEDHVEMISEKYGLQDKELVSKIVKKERLDHILKIDYITTNIIKRFLVTPKEDESVLVPIPKQHDPFYDENPLSTLSSIYTFLWDVFIANRKRNSGFAEKVLKFLNSIVNTLIVSGKELDINKLQNVEYYHPYIIVDIKVNYDIDDEIKNSLFQMFRRLENDLKKESPTQTKRVEKFLSEELFPKRGSTLKVALPIYSYVYTDYVLRDDGKEGEEIVFTVGREIGRGSIATLGGNIGIKTRCFKGRSMVLYAIIPFLEGEISNSNAIFGKLTRYSTRFITDLLKTEHGGEKNAKKKY